MASSRTPQNLSEDQKLFLVELAKKYNSIEDSGYSSESLAKKDAAWKKITLEFRAKYPGDVEETALKRLPKRIKEKAKKDMDQQRLELSGEITKL